jgi:hypothetical protein
MDGGKILMGNLNVFAALSRLRDGAMQVARAKLTLLLLRIYIVFGIFFI